MENNTQLKKKDEKQTLMVVSRDVDTMVRPDLSNLQAIKAPVCAVNVVVEAKKKIPKVIHFIRPKK